MGDKSDPSVALFGAARYRFNFFISYLNYPQNISILMKLAILVVIKETRK